MSCWRDIVPGPRHTARRMRVAIRGSVLKVLNELITNSDDSYYRLEKKGKKTSGVIQIGLWKKKKIKVLYTKLGKIKICYHQKNSCKQEFIKAIMSTSKTS